MLEIEAYLKVPAYYRTQDPSFKKEGKWSKTADNMRG